MSGTGGGASGEFGAVGAGVLVNHPNQVDCVGAAGGGGVCGRTSVSSVDVGCVLSSA